MSFNYPKACLEYMSLWPSLLIQIIFLVWCIPCIDFLPQIPGLCREDNRSCGSVLATGFSCSFSESYQLPEYWLCAARIEEVCFHRCPGEEAAMSGWWQSLCYSTSSTVRDRYPHTRENGLLSCWWYTSGSNFSPMLVKIKSMFILALVCSRKKKNTP